MSVTEQPVRREAPKAAPVVAPAPEETEQIPLAPAQTKWGVKRFFIVVLVLALVSVAGYFAVNFWLDSRQFESTDDAFIDGDIIPISPQVAAQVAEVKVFDNQVVKKGDLLVTLDPTDYQVALEQKKATEQSMIGKVAEAQTKLEVAKAEVGEAEAELNAAQTTALNMQQDLDRMNGLDPRARSQQQMDNASANQRSTSAQVKQAEAKVTAAKAQLIADEAAVATAQSDAAKAAADVHEAEIQRSYCTITSPTDGIVTRKSVEPGMYVTVGEPLCSIVPTEVWVTANFKETQLDLMRPGEEVNIYVDAYPEKPFKGKVESIQNGTGSKFSLLPPENATGNFVKVVQRVPVKIVFDEGTTEDANHRLSPGMSVIPKVRVRARETLSEALGLNGAVYK
jgi:membrane fusion protein (multidrug efflux system)